MFPDKKTEKKNRAEKKENRENRKSGLVMILKQYRFSERFVADSKRRNNLYLCN